MKSARDYLANEQKIHQMSKGSAYDELIEKQYRLTMDRVDDKQRLLLQQNLEKRQIYYAKFESLIPTPYQSKQDFGRLWEAKKRIDATLRQGSPFEQFRPRDNIVFGSVESPNLNAQSGYLRNTEEFLIIFNRELLLALLAVCNILAASSEIKPAGFTLNRKVLTRFSPVYGDLLATVLEGHVPSPDTLVTLWQTALGQQILWTILEDAGTEFIFGHEYAHVLFEHVKQPELSTDFGGWGNEYEADSLALDVLTKSWVQRHGEPDPGEAILLISGVTAFFSFLSHLEQYSAQVLGSRAFLCNVKQNHPPTHVRWGRMLSLTRDRLPPNYADLAQEQAKIVAQSLDFLFQQAVITRYRDSPEAYEFTFQNNAWRTMVAFRLVPQHIFLALRCAKAALHKGHALDEKSVTNELTTGDAELKENGVRPLLDYGGKLKEIVQNMSERFLNDSHRLDSEFLNDAIDRLMACVALDAYTRYPIPDEN